MREVTYEYSYIIIICYNRLLMKRYQPQPILIGMGNPHDVHRL